MPPREGALLKVSDQLKSVVKILGAGQNGQSAVRTSGGPILTMTCYLCKELPIWGRDDRTRVKILLVALTF